MCGRQAPLTGADSVHPDQLSVMDLALAKRQEVERPYRVLIEEWDGGRQWFTVRAIGPKGARGTAFQAAIDKGLDPMAATTVEAA